MESNLRDVSFLLLHYSPIALVVIVPNIDPSRSHRLYRY